MEMVQDRATREQMGEWVCKKLEPDLTAFSPEVARRFRAYHRAEPEGLERSILRAAHYIATKWEFSFILHWSADMYGVDQTRREIEPVSSALSRRRTVIPAPSRASTQLRMRAGSGCGDRKIEESGCVSSKGVFSLSRK